MNLDELRKIAEREKTRYRWVTLSPEEVIELLDRVEKAEQAYEVLQRVRDRHQPCLSCLEPHCFVCEKAKWPCAEFRALEGNE